MKLLNYLLTAVLLFGIVQNGIARENEPAKLMVSGEARIHKPAEKAVVHISVVTEDVHSEKAVFNNNLKMQKVIEALKGLGLTHNEFKTGQFTVRPRYSDQTIKGYEVANSLSISTEKIHLAGDMIAAVNRAGVNSIDSIQFTVKDPKAYRAEALQAAAANAMADAQMLAQTTGVKLVRVLELSAGQSSEHYPMPRYHTMMAKGFDSNNAPIEAGNVEIVANVFMIYEISSSP
ncbi:SIMPL domain-containing protein [Parachlamydia sp. AcF125]|uniref:SIMPL domain-containing protein n=1 Tax=Parachlamydia sp. AcF125 TaxID=2795736 RepID=UPI001BC9D29A|nr:SIMPL domain-containing protein [Parachlamydia sp. AcF125]MBS4169109.1 26 kDa periplasmic immunogenic protein [Parachlamydia sp. AcF125]